MPPPHPYIFDPGNYLSRLFSTYPIVPTPFGQSMDTKGKASVGDTVRVVSKPRTFVIAAMNDEFIYEDRPDGSQRIYRREDHDVYLIKRGDDPANDPINTIRERLDGPGVWLKTGADGWKILGGVAPTKLYGYSNVGMKAMLTNPNPVVGKVIGMLAARHG